MIFDSETVPGRPVVVLALKDTNGASVVVPFALNVKGVTGTYEMNAIASIYGKGKNATNVGWISRQIENGRLKYINKKAAAREFSQHALQLRSGKLSTTTQNIPNEDDLVKLKSENPEFYQTARGSVNFMEDGRRVISLFEAADESTLAHEAGHIFLEDLGQIAAQETASAQVRADWIEVRRYLGMKKDQAAPTREQHEKFANAFLAYLREGKSPT
jgi:hypothetical protein